MRSPQQTQIMLNISLADKSSAQTLASKKSDYLALDEIRRDGGTQPRAAINLHHVNLLTEQMEDGQQLECEWDDNFALTGTITLH